MSGLYTAIAATVVSAGAGIYESSKSGAIANHADNRGAAVFSEQQQYASQLANLMSNPSSVKDLPGYKFNFDQGTQAVARQMGASGLAGSGNEGIALERFGAGYADSAYSTQANLLASLSGLQTAASPAQYGQVATQAQGQSFQELSQALAGLGYSLGGGSTGGFTTNDAVTLAGGGYSKMGSTMPAGGGYIWNVPGKG